MDEGTKSAQNLGSWALSHFGLCVSAEYPNTRSLSGMDPTQEQVWDSFWVHFRRFFGLFKPIFEGFATRDPILRN